MQYHMYQNHTGYQASRTNIVRRTKTRRGKVELEENIRKKGYTDGSRTWTCDKCGKESKTYSAYYAHKQGHIFKESGKCNKIKCELCGREVAGKKGMKTHIKFVHEKHLH